MRIALATSKHLPHGIPDDAPLQRALTEAGHEVAFEIWNNSEVVWSTYDLCLVRSTWDYFHHVIDFLHWIEKVSKEAKLLNSKETLLWNASKDYLVEVGKKDVHVVPTRIVRTVKELNSLNLNKAHEKYIIKPNVSADAHMTFCVDSKKDFLAAGEKILETASVVIQPFVDSVIKAGEVSLIYFKVSQKVNFSHAVLKTPKAGDFRVQANHGGREEPIEPSEKLIQMGYQSLQHAPGDWVYARVDILDWQKKPMISEIEMIEPQLFFKYSSEAADDLTAALMAFVPTPKASL